MRRPKTVFMALAGTMILALATIASAGASHVAHGSTGGCSAWGRSYVVSSSYSYTQTDATQTGGCNWTKSVAWVSSGGYQFEDGVGWKSASIATSDFNYYVDWMYGFHDLCTSSPECGSTYWTTGASQ